MLTKKGIEKIQEEHQQAIEEKDAALAMLTDDLQGRDNQIQSIKYENVALQSQKDVYQAELQMQEIQAKITLSSLYGNIQHLPMISFMTCHIMLRGYNDVKSILS